MHCTAELLCVNPANVAGVWRLVRGPLQSAMDRTQLGSIEELESDVLEGRQLLWLAIARGDIFAVATTHLVKPGEDKVCVLTACAGHHRETWLPLFAFIEEYARAEGAKKMRIFGRKGWERVLDGYHVEHVVLEKVM
jgi:hypothetical protein